jgi:hypothetical protein
VDKANTILNRVAIPPPKACISRVDVPEESKRYIDLSLLIVELLEEIVSMLDGASEIPFCKPKSKS